jgi:hypothetical protein
MFDLNESSFVETKGRREGPIVEFTHEIKLRNVKLLTRNDCCSEELFGYYNVCLLVDEKQVACTPDNYVIDWGRWISFKVKSCKLYFRQDWFFRRFWDRT